MITKEQLEEIKAAHVSISQCQDSSMMMFDLINRLTNCVNYVPALLDEVERLQKIVEQGPSVKVAMVERMEM